MQDREFCLNTKTESDTCVPLVVALRTFLACTKEIDTMTSVRVVATCTLMEGRVTGRHQVRLVDEPWQSSGKLDGLAREDKSSVGLQPR